MGAQGADVDADKYFHGLGVGGRGAVWRARLGHIGFGRPTPAAPRNSEPCAQTHDQLKELRSQGREAACVHAASDNATQTGGAPTRCATTPALIAGASAGCEEDAATSAAMDADCGNATIGGPPRQAPPMALARCSSANVRRDARPASSESNRASTALTGAAARARSTSQRAHVPSRRSASDLVHFGRHGLESVHGGRPCQPTGRGRPPLIGHLGRGHGPLSIRANCSGFSGGGTWGGCHMAGFSLSHLGVAPTVKIRVRSTKASNLSWSRSPPNGTISLAIRRRRPEVGQVWQALVDLAPRIDQNRQINRNRVISDR